MRKQDLVKSVAGKVNQSESQTTQLVNAVFDTIEEALARGEDVTISGFGSFRVVDRPAREGRNPQTGEPIQIAARKSPTFSPGSELKRLVNEGQAS
jgi:DNA-binding protein HU-beta